jgi:3-deoxy-D-manno-octulosonate 8-phosphate phosphatase (KDO 8-P phosphatase)
MKENNGQCQAGSSYPSDCEVTQGLRERAARRQPVDTERGYVWRSCFPRASRVKILLLDVDGVLTDGTITYTQGGGESKSFNTKDGLGIRLLQRAGIETGLITARSSEAVTRRAEDLGLTHVYQKAGTKLEVFEKILAELDITPEQVAYMGDDWLDIPLLIRVGFAATVADAVPEVKKLVHYVATRPGGRGAVREVCDLILEANGKTEQLLATYLEQK